MEADDFIERLKQIPKNLERYDLSSEDLKSLNEEYTLKNKDSIEFFDDPIKNLISNYQLSNFEIGMISFDEKITEDHDFFYFGKFEIDLMCVEKSTSQVAMLNSENYEIAFYCAGNSWKFLNAIWIAASFLERRAWDDNLYENEKINKEIAEECADVAGNREKYYDFYTMMFGF